MIPAPQSCLFLGVLSLFAANQLKCLSMKYLRQKISFSGQAQSSLVKPNQGVFLSRRALHSVTPILHHFTGNSVFRGPKQPLISSHFQNWTPRLAACLAAFTVILAGGPARAQEEVLAKEAYLMPPKVIADAVLASRNDRMALTNLSPDGKVFLITKTGGLPSLELMAHPYIHLSEMTFDPIARRARDLWVRSAIACDLFYYAEKRTVPVQIPPHARVSNPLWSPDGSQLAFFALLDEGTRIYIADTKTGTSAPLTSAPIVATLATAFRWSKDGQQIEAVLVPNDKMEGLPKPSSVATKPRVRLVRGGLNPPARTAICWSRPTR